LALAYLPRQFGHKVNPATVAQDNVPCGKKVALKTAAWWQIADAAGAAC
jgi:hypothetical protein